MRSGCVEAYFICPYGAYGLPRGLNNKWKLIDMIFVSWNPGVREVRFNCETAMYSVCEETNYIKVKNDVTWLFTWRHFIDYTGVVGIQVEKPRGNPHEKYRDVC